MKTSNYSTVLTVTTDPLGLDTPILDAMGTITYNSAVINWLSVDNAQGYKIYLENIDDTLIILDDLNVNNVTTYTLTGLYQNTNYQYKVKAYYNTLESDYSVSDDFVTADFVILPPIIGDNTDLTFHSVIINWTKRSNATSYKIYLENLNTSTVILNGIDIGDVNTYLFDGLDFNSDYLWKIKSYNSVINEESSYSSNQMFTTLKPIPDTPEMLPSTSITYNTFVANWTEVTYADLYDLEVYLDSTLETLHDAYSNLSTNSQLINALSPLTNYYIVVSAKNESGVSAKSAYILTTTKFETQERMLYIKSDGSSINQIFSNNLTGTDEQVLTNFVSNYNLVRASYDNDGNIYYSRYITDWRMYYRLKSENYSTEYNLVDNSSNHLKGVELKVNNIGNQLVFSNFYSTPHSLVNIDLNTKITSVLYSTVAITPTIPNYSEDDNYIYFVTSPNYTITNTYQLNKLKISDLSLSTVIASGIYNTVYMNAEIDGYVFFMNDDTGIRDDSFTSLRKKNLTTNTYTDLKTSDNFSYADIEVNTVKDKLFVSRWNGSQYKIYSYNLDGTGETLLIGGSDSKNYTMCDLRAIPI